MMTMDMTKYQGHTKEVTEVEVITDIAGGYCLMLYNDDFNTFDHVINCLVKYCRHAPEQAEQCSLIVHYKGKCAVKHGGAEELEKICDALCMEDLSAVVENTGV